MNKSRSHCGCIYPGALFIYFALFKVQLFVYFALCKVQNTIFAKET